ncbi:HAD-IA family hydrolase [candidate division WWE3 bacterium]|uniref:HAD-IA family hydrolase n=1 Tax=candidate division WWE3 bacterium TaxID=2053526 RepID=A0A955RR20_UNCKA|nr:HAD-IA family hydrolase [candidate division WWE3 bacterium]
MTYPYILFDWDGCLAKTLDVWLAAYQYAFGLYDIEVPDSEIIRVCFGRKEGPVELGVDDEYEFINHLVEYADRKMKSVSLHESVEDTLNFLYESDATMGLITSSKRELVEPVLERLNIDYFFEALMTQDDVTTLKPDPEVVFEMMGLLSADQKQTIIVGDSPHDVGAGQNAGIATVYYYPESNKKYYSQSVVDDSEADYVIKSIGQLIDIVA